MNCSPFLNLNLAYNLQFRSPLFQRCNVFNDSVKIVVALRPFCPYVLRIEGLLVEVGGSMSN